MSCFGTTGTPILYTSAYSRLISSFNTNATMSLMSLPAQRFQHECYYKFNVSTGTTTVASTPDATILRLATSITITLILAFMLESALVNFDKLANMDTDTNIMAITTHSLCSDQPLLYKSVIINFNLQKKLPQSCFR